LIEKEGMQECRKEGKGGRKRRGGGNAVGREGRNEGRKEKMDFQKPAKPGAKE
jgi:hypothetical protein